MSLHQSLHSFPTQINIVWSRKHCQLIMTVLKRSRDQRFIQIKRLTIKRSTITSINLLWEYETYHQFFLVLKEKKVEIDRIHSVAHEASILKQNELATWESQQWNKTAVKYELSKTFIRSPQFLNRVYNHSCRSVGPPFSSLAMGALWWSCCNLWQKQKMKLQWYSDNHNESTFSAQLFVTIR